MMVDVIRFTITKDVATSNNFVSKHILEFTVEDRKFYVDVRNVAEYPPAISIQAKCSH